MPAKKIALSLIVVAASGAYVWGEGGRVPADDPVGSDLPVADAKASPAERRASPPAFASPSPTGVPVFTTEPLGTPPTPAAGVAGVARRDETTEAADDLPAEAVASEPALPAPAATVLAAAPSATEPAPAPAVAEPAPVPADEAPAAEPPKPVVVAESAPALQSLNPQAAKTRVKIPVPRPRPAYHAQHADATPGPAVSVASSTGSISASSPLRAPTAPAAADKKPGDGAFTGPAVDAYYGLVQVEAVVENGQLVDVRVLQYPSHRRTSVSINRRALPMLHDEVIMAQNTKVDVVSGATLTSVAFMRSLTAALRHGGA